MTDFIELHLKPETLAELGLPDIGYLVPRDDFDAETGRLPLAMLLYGLQWKSARAGAERASLEPAMERLALLLTPDADDAVVTAGGDDWELAIGGVNLAGEDRDRRVVALQRGAQLVAAVRPLPSGQLRVSAYRPLDSHAAELLVQLAQLPRPGYGVQSRKNNWEFAMALAGDAASARGDTRLVFWPQGLGRLDAGDDPAWRAQAELAPRRAASVAAELGAWYTYSEPQ